MKAGSVRGGTIIFAMIRLTAWLYWGLTIKTMPTSAREEFYDVEISVAPSFYSVTTEFFSPVKIGIEFEHLDSEPFFLYFCNSCRVRVAWSNYATGSDHVAS